MSSWKRPLRPRAGLRRWIATLRATLHDWSLRYRRLLARCWFSPRLRSPRRVRLALEGLEERDLLNAAPGLPAPPTDTTPAPTMAALATAWEQQIQQFAAAEIDVLSHTPLGQAVGQADYWLAQSLAATHQLIDQLLHPANPPPAANGSLTPAPDPAIAFTEGIAGQNVTVGFFSDSDGNTDASKYSVSINWGNGQTTPGTVQYYGGQFMITGTMTYADEGNYPITATVTDADGTTTTVTATAQVSDGTLNPVTTMPVSATAGRQFSGPLMAFQDQNPSAAPGDYTIAVNWGDGQTGSGTAVNQGSYFNVNGTHTYANSGSYTVTVTVTDDGGSQTSASTTATVAGNPLSWSGGSPSFSWGQTPAAAPGIIGPGSQTNTEGNSVSLQVQASDPNNNPLTYDAVNLPPGLSINSTTGLISGTVQDGAAEDFDGSYNTTVLVANNQGGSAQTSFTWTVNQAQIAPVLTNPGAQTDLRGDNVSLQLSASQADGDALSYDATGLPDGLSIDGSTGLISGTVDPSATLGTPYAVTVTATDQATNLTASQTFNWTVGAANVAPVLTTPGNQTNAACDDVSLQLSASDADGDGLTYTAAGLPPGLSIDPSSGLISGTLPNAAASATPYNVTVTASDGMAGSSQTFTWAVNAVSLQSPGDQSNLDGDAVSLQLSASDATGATLTYSATGLPPGLSLNGSSGLISGTIGNTADASSPYAVTVTATDGSHSASQSFNWTVGKLALNSPGDQDNQEGTAVSLQLSASDAVGTPMYSATGLPPGLTLNSSTGLITGTVGLGAFGSSPYQVTVTATDGAATSSQSFVWTVTPRVALVSPGSQSNAAGDSLSLQLSATSPGGTMSYSATGLPNGLSINGSAGLISGTLASSDASATPYTVTVTASDGTSHSSQTFAWTVSAINLVSPGDQTNLDGDSISLQLSAGYHGSGTLGYRATGLPPGLSINSTTGQITGSISGTADTNSPCQVTVTATDGTNTSSQTFNWTVNPLVSIGSIDDQSNAAGDAVSLQVMASDVNSNAALSYSATGLPPGLNINSTTGLISGTIATGADGTSPYAVTVTTSDGTVSDTQSFNWTVAHVALVNPGPQASVDGQAVSLQLQAHDADGDTVTYTATGLPPGLSLNGSTGLISGTLTADADAGGPYSVTVTAGDGSNTTTQTFLWTVTQVAITGPGDRTNTEGDAVSLQLQGQSDGGTLSYSAGGLPDGLSLNPTTGLISGTVAAGAAADGPFTTTVAVSNGTVSSSQQFTWTVNPVVALTAPADQSNKEGDSVSLQVTATDGKNAALTYSATGLPSGLSINSSTGPISGTVAAGDSAKEPYAVVVTAVDGTYSSSVTFNWAVTHADTTALSMTNPGTQVNAASDGVNLQVRASDPDADALIYSATGLPDGLTIDSSSGIISGTVADDAATSTPYQVTVTAADGNVQSVSQTFTWLVNAPALSVQATPVSAVEGNDAGSITLATFTTPDLNAQAGDFVALITWGDGTTDAAMVSGGNGSFTVTGDHTYAEKGNYAVSIQVSDSLTGGSATVSTTAAVTDAPLTLTGGFQLGAVVQQSLSQALATFTDGNSGASATDFTATIDYGDGSGPQAATVSDGGDGVFSVLANHAFSQKGTYTATITVTDADGATATATSTVVVGDVYAGTPATLTVATFQDSNTSVQASQLTAVISWGDGTTSSGTVTGGYGLFSVQGTHTYAQDSFDQPGGAYAVSVTITDASGDTLTGDSTVAVVRPLFSLTVANVNLASSLSVSNAAVALFTEPAASDPAAEFTTQVNWGDGTPLDSSAVVQEVSPGLFAVMGGHTYAASGWYTVTVQVSQAGAAAARIGAGAGLAGGKPIIELVTDKNVVTHTLNVAKWESAFERLNEGRIPPQIKRVGNFTNDDPDCFDVFVEDPAAAKAGKPITVSVSTSSDPGHNIGMQLKNAGKGYFRGNDWLLLTSFPVDNREGGNKTFLVKLGDTVRASYGGVTATATVPVQKVVKLHINILRDKNDGNPVATKDQVETDVANANRIYAQVGIRFQATIQTVNPPPGVDLSDGLDSFLGNWTGRGKIPMTAEEKALLGAANLRTNVNDDIEVYYINRLASTKVIGPQGEAFNAAGVPEAKYADSLIVAYEWSDDITLAHEIGHILLNSGLHPDGAIRVNKVNLMVSSPWHQAKGTVTDSRRIIASQADDMLSERPNLLSNP